MPAIDSEVPTIGFLHTSAAHVPTFDRLVAEHSDGFETATVVDQNLLVLAEASMAGAVSLVESSTPVLSSPEPAVQTAVRSVQNQLDDGGGR